MNINEWLFTNFILGSELQSKIVGTIIIFAVLWLLRLVILQFINHRIKDIRTRYYWRKFSTYAVVFLGVVLVSPLWLSNLQSLATFFGLAVAGIVVALQDVLANFAGWIFILTRRPFEVGDRVQIGELAGDVVDIRIFEFTVLEIGNWVGADQSTGRVLHIPNGKIFKEALANYSKGFEYIWHEIPVLITFESNWEKTKAILEEIVNQEASHLSKDAPEQIKRASNHYMIMYSHVTPTVYTSVVASGVLLTIRYLCNPRRRRSSEQELWEKILKAFAKHSDIELAYPTQRFYHRQPEIEPQGRVEITPDGGS